MSREDDFAARMIADSTLMQALTGGIYKWEDIGPVGIRRGDDSPTSAAFDADGYLLPCALVKEGQVIPTGEVVDYDAQIESVRQTVQVWLYQDRGYDQIDAAVARLRVLFFGVSFADTFEPRVGNVLNRLRDPGALKGASMARIDFQLDFVLELGG